MMLGLRDLLILGFLGVGAVVDCAASPDPDSPVVPGPSCATNTDCSGGAAGAGGGGTSGPSCATDTDCSAATPKCSHAGMCIQNWACNVDADCRGSTPVCHDYFQECEPCREDADCPSAAPACVPNWEVNGVYCAQCRVGDSTVCPTGSWCTSNQQIQIGGGGGVCEPPNCKSDPTGLACISCLRENYVGCDGDGGECTEPLAALRACYAAADPTWDESNCPILTVPSSYGCSPQGCTEESSAVDKCLVGCAYVTSRCDM